MAAKIYHQCVLRSGESTLVCWLDGSKIKPGMKVTLKDSGNPELWWTIDTMSSLGFPKNELKDEHVAQKWFENDYRHKLTGLVIKE